jgi:hypothetical protein
VLHELDGRAMLAAICAVLAVPVSVNPFFALVFGPIGLLAALSAVTGDRRPSARTRALACLASAACAVFLAIGLYVVLVRPRLAGT